MTQRGIIDRTDAVLVVIDIQERLAAAMPHRDEVVSVVALLANAARVLELPVVVTRQYPEGLGDTVRELAGPLGGIMPVDKMTFCCVREPSFTSRLDAIGKRQVVLCGMEAHICVTQTALALLDEGYEVHVVADAVCSRSDRDRDVALRRLRAAGAVVTVSESVLYEALGEAGTPAFKAVLDLVKRQSSSG